MVVKWSLSEGDKGAVVAKVEASVYAMALDGNLLVVGQNYEGLHFIDLTTGEETGSIFLSKAAFFDIQVIEGNYWVAAGDGEVIVVNPQRQVLFRSHLSEKSARCMTYIPNRREVAVGFSDHSIKVINCDTFKSDWSIEAHENSVFALVTSPDQRFILSGSRDAHLKIWHTDNYTLSQSIVAHMYAINHVAFSPNGQYFVTCSMDKSVKVWNAETFKLLKVIDKARHAGHGTSVNKLQWLTNNKVASCSDDRTVSVWDLEIV